MNAVKLVAEAMLASLERCEECIAVDDPYSNASMLHGVDSVMPHARAAIAALLKLLEEPTEGMVQATSPSLSMQLVAKAYWRTMLAAWRKEMGV